jgi:hypothetical protein
MDTQELEQLPHHEVVINRFVTACQADERVVATTLYGSHARGATDAYSDLDLGLITTDESYEAFCAEREAFIRHLGEPLFQEDFGSASSVFFILADGTEGELAIGRASQFDQLHDEPYKVLLDKQNILAGAVFRPAEPDSAGQTETLRRLIYWFWHDFSHFITAMGRGQLWWAQGQLEIVRRICVNLARLHHNFADPYAGAEDFFKVEQALPVARLTPLETTFCAMEAAAMLEAGRTILHFYQELAPALARAHGIPYPAALEQVMVERLKKMFVMRLR